MRSLTSVLLVVACAVPCFAAPAFSFHVLGDDPGSWPAILSSIGLAQDSAAGSGVVVAPAGTDVPAPEWTARVEHGTLLVLEGDSPLAKAFGFRPTSQRVMVQSVEDLRAPKLRIIWEKALELPVFEIPPASETLKDARVFARERWQHAPLMAGYRRGAGAVLWLAASPGPRGYERFPYILQALADLGFEAPFRSRQLWAFFDSAYRARVDPDYFAARWRAAGIGALHVAAWHYWEHDPQADEYLRRLIEACHRQAILVYAWFELPHVSEKFWDDHPEWREKTALGQDAQLDWRKLMNLTNRAAFASVSEGVRDLTGRFDWDGVNLAELYFESLEGYQNPARFTPLNSDIRAEFGAAARFDPSDLFDAASQRYYAKNAGGLAKFLAFRADVARRQQTEWIAQIEAIRKIKPHLDLVLTHVDDRFDTSMREKIGADASRLLPLLNQHDFTFLIEDPATIWNLGPERYPQIAASYRALTPGASLTPTAGALSVAGALSANDKLAIDINVVERYQDVYPTKQQTGVELFELVHTAARSFHRVALYFENSILPPDLPLLASAASSVNRVEQVGAKLTVESRGGVGVPWHGPALVDGRPWPASNDTTLWLTRGVHVIEAAGGPTSTAKPPTQPLSMRLLDFNGELTSANLSAGGIEFTYESSALLDRMPGRVAIDGREVRVQFVGRVLLLPRGQHLVTVFNQLPPK